MDTLLIMRLVDIDVGNDIGTKADIGIDVAFTGDVGVKIDIDIVIFDR